jgi:hypothetical protein
MTVSDFWNDIDSEDTLRLATLGAIQRIHLLCGCSQCGRRLIHDDKVIPGTCVIYENSDDTLVRLLGKSVCKHCAKGLIFDNHTHRS